MNIVLLTTGRRTELLKQSIASLTENAAKWDDHTLTVSVDGDGYHCDIAMPTKYTVIFNACRPSASACRNIGASSIPKYLRHKHVCFFDDDIYAVRGWDEQLEHVSNFFRPGSVIVSGHAHPYNRTVLRETPDFITTNVISTVQMFMSWDLWDNIGFFTEPGGPGGSEDVDYCKRATDRYFNLAITKPQCVIHAGLTSSNGTPIVGEDLVRGNNRRLEEIHGIVGKVTYT